MRRKWEQATRDSDNCTASISTAGRLRGSLHTGWALRIDGIIRRTSPSLIPLGAYVDAIMAGSDEADADNIARAIKARPWPTYEERMAVFSPAGPWKPPRDPFTTSRYP